MVLAVGLAGSGVWSKLVVDDPFFGWGPHALCLGLSWILGPMVVANIGVAIEYGLLPFELHRARRANPETFGPVASQVRTFERFIAACGLGHALRVIAMFVPTLTVALVVVDWLTLGVSKDARLAVAKAAAEFEGLRASRDEAIRAREHAVEEAASLRMTLRGVTDRITGRAEQIESRQAEIEEALITAKHARAVHRALEALLETSKEAVAIYDLDALTLDRASVAFWRLLGREAPEGPIPLVSVIAPDHRESAIAACRDRPLSGVNSPPFPIDYLHENGDRVSLIFSSGYVPGVGEGPIAWFRVKTARPESPRQTNKGNQS